MLLSRAKLSQASQGRTDAILLEAGETEVPGSSAACNRIHRLLCQESGSKLGSRHSEAPL